MLSNVPQPTDKLSDFFKRVERTERRLQAVLEIGKELATTLSPNQLLPKIMDKVTLLMDAERSTLFLADNRELELVSRILQGEEEREFRIPFGQGIAGWVAQSGLTLNIPDAYQEERFDPSFDQKTGYQTRSVLCLPFHNQVGVLMGVVQVLNKKSSLVFDEEDIQLLQSIMAQAALFLENADLYSELWNKNIEVEYAYKELEKNKKTIDILYEIEKEISQSHGFHDLLHRPLQKTTELLKAQAGCIFLLSSEMGQFRCEASTCKDIPKENILLPFGKGIVGQVALDKQTLVQNALSAFPELEESKAFNIPIKSILCMPFFHEGEVFGVLELVNSQKENGFRTFDVRLLEQIMGSFGRAIRIEMERNEKEKNSRLSSIGQLLSELAHDLKGPITVIQGYAQMMVTQEDSNKRNNMSLKIQKQIERMTQMTSEILSFARGDSSILIRKIQLSLFVNEIEEILKQEFLDGTVAYQIHVDYQGEVSLDETKFHRLVYNLARNAHQAMRGQGRFVVNISANPAQNELLFSFQDSGKGIPLKLQPRVFESFVKGDPQKGTGLGLSIVKKIVEEHKGKITFESSEQGTTFLVSLPLVPF